MPTELYEQMINHNYSDKVRKQLMQEAWSPTPWMVDIFTGSIINDNRYRDMVDWCRERHGREHSPTRWPAGDWRRGSATINGWTWFGFRTKQQMDEFISEWGIMPNNE